MIGMALLPFGCAGTAGVGIDGRPAFQETLRQNAEP